MEKEFSQREWSLKDLRHALMSAEPGLLSGVLQFIIDDPKTFRSGYYKQVIWKYVKRYSLSEGDIHQLEQTVLNKYLTRPMCPEFKYMCQTMGRIATLASWDQVRDQLDSDNQISKINASCLYPYSKGILDGEKQRLTLRQQERKHRYELLYKEDFRNSFLPYEIIDDIINDKNNWRGRMIVTQAPYIADLPIAYYSVPPRDYHLVELKLEELNRSQVLPKIRDALLKGQLHNSHTAWLYLFYLLYRLHDPESVPIIAEFLQEKIDWKIFDSPSKGITLTCVCKALQVIGTSDALELFDKYKSEAWNIGGWLTFPEKQET